MKDMVNHLIKKVEGNRPPKSPCNNALKHPEELEKEN